MLAVTLAQVIATMVAVYFGAKVAMSLGRDVRSAIFRRVQVFSAREVGTFGAPSLITRTTNDVQQVQMVVMLSLTLLVAAPVMAVGGVIMALRQDVQLSGLLLVVIPVLLVFILVRRVADAAAVPLPAAQDRRDQPDHARADHRHPRDPRLRARHPRARALRRAPTRTCGPWASRSAG